MVAGVWRVLCARSSSPLNPPHHTPKQQQQPTDMPGGVAALLQTATRPLAPALPAAPAAGAGGGAGGEGDHHGGGPTGEARLGVLLGRLEPRGDAPGLPPAPPPAPPAGTTRHSLPLPSLPTARHGTDPSIHRHVCTHSPTLPHTTTTNNEQPNEPVNRTPKRTRTRSPWKTWPGWRAWRATPPASTRGSGRRCRCESSRGSTMALGTCTRSAAGRGRA